MLIKALAPRLRRQAGPPRSIIPAMKGRAFGGIAVALAGTCLLIGACGRSTSPTGSTGNGSAGAGQLLPCKPADEKKQGSTTPAPCVSINVEKQIQDNLKYLNRLSPQPTDVAALQGAASDLNQVFQALRDKGLYDAASVQQTVGTKSSLAGARVRAPVTERLFTTHPTVVVFLEHRSACLIGEHGPERSVVNVVGQIADGGCEAVYGH